MTLSIRYEHQVAKLSGRRRRRHPSNSYLGMEADARMRHERWRSADVLWKAKSTICTAYAPWTHRVANHTGVAVPLHDWREVASPLSDATAAAVCQ